MKVVFVTGASRGIGASTARLFAKNGYTVILNYRESEEAVKKLQRELVEQGADAHVLRADVSSEREISDAFAYIKKYFKHLDVLVNCAGVSFVKLCQDVTAAEYDKIMDINAKGTFLACRDALKLFLHQGYGSIVNVASIWGTHGAACESVYAMSKHAVVGLTRSLAQELSLSNITVNCVCPPIVRTRMTEYLSEQDISEFCEQHGTKAYSPEMVAEDIYRLATCGESGVILNEK